MCGRGEGGVGCVGVNVDVGVCVWVDLFSHSTLLHDVTAGRQIPELGVCVGGGCVSVNVDVDVRVCGSIYSHTSNCCTT